MYLKVNSFEIFQDLSQAPDSHIVVLFSFSATDVSFCELDEYYSVKHVPDPEKLENFYELMANAPSRSEINAYDLGLCSISTAQGEGAVFKKNKNSDVYFYEDTLPDNLATRGCLAYLAELSEEMLDKPCTHPRKISTFVNTLTALYLLYL